MLEKAVTLMQEHDLHPYIGNIYEWEDALKAFEQLKSQNFIGKLVIKV
jgi:NADPH:quinone reductase-like Zn-dependent oxidoreductase